MCVCDTIFEDRPLASEVIVPKGSILELEPVGNTKYNTARIFLSALFTGAHAGGLTVELFWGSTRMGDIMSIKSSNGSGSGASEPFDINHLNGFRFVIRNRDNNNATTVRNMKIILYNE